MKKSVYNNFKQQLGEISVAVQFTELTKKYFLDNNLSLGSLNTNSDSSDVTLDELTKTYGLTLSYRAGDFVDGEVSTLINTTICSNYITNVHMCFEEFLSNLKRHISDFSNYNIQEKGPNQSSLEHLYYVILDSVELRQQSKNLFLVSEYYRNVRNTNLHNLDSRKKLKSQLQNIQILDIDKETKYGVLSAPNNFDKLTYDDFILFSKVTLRLAYLLYKHIAYSDEKILNYYKRTYSNKINNIVTNERKAKHFKNFLRESGLTYNNDI